MAQTAITNQNKLERLLSNKPIKCEAETESEDKGLSNRRINSYSVATPYKPFLAGITQLYYLKQGILCSSSY